MDEPRDHPVEVHYLGPDGFTRIFPELRHDGDTTSLEDALGDPASVYADLKETPHNGDWRLVVAYSGWPDVVIYIGGAVATGVVGNAAYDALKVLLRDLSNRIGGAGSANSYQLTETSAIKVARTLVQAWADDPGRARVGVASLDRSGRWVVEVVKNGVTHEVHIPRGRLDGAKVLIKRRDSRSLIRRMCDGGRSRISMWYWNMRSRF